VVFKQTFVVDGRVENSVVIVGGKKDLYWDGDKE
jgi:hypothetical protein